MTRVKTGSQWADGIRARTLCCALLCAIAMASCTGCASPGKTVFDATEIGGPWKEVPGHEIYPSHGFSWFIAAIEFREGPGGKIEAYLDPPPLFYHEDGYFDGDGTFYLIVRNEDGIVVAKAKVQLEDPLRRSLVASGACLSELMEVEQDYPFPSRELQIPEGVKIEGLPSLPPEEVGTILPSGTRERSWARLAEMLEGFPFAGQDWHIRVWVDGQERSWEVVKAELKQGELHGLVEIIESPHDK